MAIMKIHKLVSYQVKQKENQHKTASANTLTHYLIVYD